MQVAKWDVSQEWRQSNCDDCGAPVLWTKVQLSGKKIPMDVENELIEPSGTQYLADAQGHVHPVSSELRVYTSHLATCPVRDRDED